jgi:CRISPR-associated endonuclease/helicase Cas3
MMQATDPHPHLLAKSAHDGTAAISLFAHLGQVAQAAKAIAAGLGWPVAEQQLVERGAWLHDIGKAHPYFQHTISGNRIEDSLREKIKHRHEVSSLAFLPLFPESQWQELIEMVAAHHKSIIRDPSDRGLLDISQYEHDLAQHIDWNNGKHHQRLPLADWATWSVQGLAILRALGLEDVPENLPEDAALHALSYAVDVCNQHEAQNTRSRWRGVLMAADHMASAMNNRVEGVVGKLFKKPDLQWFHDPSRAAEPVLFPLAAKATDDPRPHTLVVAPTGAGKTDFLMKRCRGRVFYVLPYQASINAMFERLQRACPHEHVQLLHSTSTLVAEAKGQKPEDIELQPFVGAGIKVLTPHQLAASVLGTLGHEAQMLDLTGCDIVLDEIHTYPNFTQAFVLALAETLAGPLKCRVHVGTATMPTVLQQEILRRLGGQPNTLEQRLTDDELTTYDRHTVFRHTDFPHHIVQEAIAQHEKLLIVKNTVLQAQQLYQELQRQFPDVPMLLLHSRFRRKDRNDLEESLMDNFDRDPETGTDRTGPCIVVSTQVVEVSLDISFDRMITDAAPLDALVQRFGRINRRREHHFMDKRAPVHVLAPTDNTLPYLAATVKSSYELLPPDGHTLRATELQPMLDAVYPTLEVNQIGAHLAWENGQFRRFWLQHVSTSKLSDILEMDGEVAILSEDEPAYRHGDLKIRQELEIPISGKSLHKLKFMPRKLEGIGRQPYVFDSRDQPLCNTLGLLLQPDTNIF